jgi:hypothetical protein
MQALLSYLEGRCRQHTSAYVSIRQHTSAYACSRTWRADVLEDELLARTGKRVLITGVRQHTSAYVSIRQHMSEYACSHRETGPDRQHTSAYVSIRQHTSAPGNGS